MNSLYILNDILLRIPISLISWGSHMAKEPCVQLCVYQRNCKRYRNNEKLDSDFLKGCTRENLKTMLVLSVQIKLGEVIRLTL